MGWKIIKGILWFILCVDVLYIFVFLFINSTQGWPPSELPKIPVLLIPAILAGITLWRMKNRGGIEKVIETYEARLKRWEDDGYVVSEIKEEWLSAKEAEIKSHKYYWLAVALNLIILPAIFFVLHESQETVPTLTPTLDIQQSEKSYVLSGGPSPVIPIAVDDDLIVEVNGKVIMEDIDRTANITNPINPITFSALPEDSIHIIAIDSGGWKELSSLYLIIDQKAYKITDGISRSEGSDQIFFDVTFTISSLVRAPPLTSYSIPGLVAYYPFDHDVRDYSGHGNDGTIEGNISFVPGVIGNGARFDGKSLVRVADNNLLDLYDAFTFSVWLYKEDAGVGGYSVIISKGDTSALGKDSPYSLSHTPDGLRPTIRLANQNFIEDVGTTTQVSFKYWYLLTVTWNGANVKFYVNGSLADTKTWYGPLSNSYANLLIGCDPPGAIEYFKGIMDELRIYNYSLNLSEIEVLYKQGNRQ